ncbi:MAG: 2-polyprenyl-3-methyl-6-methoxy-1,4-benzoquinone monooxygenase [Burkholderiales bacterium]|jgi:ubiquinone biosynthesis monooxygenase Coq7|nr:2-polyprenyl-3-methyl-6-methoxy-1,4-benzoquinone monooxygenase [Burkholderiales bacterium]
MTSAARLRGIDRLLAGVDRTLRTLLAPPHARRARPGESLPEPDLSPDDRRHAAALMRVNHTGEVCAQALYQGQLLGARDPAVRALLARAADEEADHLAWTRQRIDALDGRTSRLDPLFYAGAFAMGAVSSLAGDRWNLGFLAETERQVEAHLDDHLARLPEADAPSRAVLEQMRADEADHAQHAKSGGGAELPRPVRAAMRAVSRVMTTTTYHV